MSKALEAVYAAKTPDELKSAYARWAESYDRETLSDGYHLPFTIAAFIARHVAPGAGPLLDAGCGTGLSGMALAALGYGDVEGLDFSPAMLAAAAARGTYSRLVQAELGKALPYEDRRFAAVFSAGVFTAGHAPASSLNELARIIRPGGHLIVTVRGSVLESGGFTAKFADLADRMTLSEESGPFRAFALSEPEVTVKAFVFAVH